VTRPRKATDEQVQRVLTLRQIIAIDAHAMLAELAGHGIAAQAVSAIPPSELRHLTLEFASPDDADRAGPVLRAAGYAALVHDNHIMIFYLRGDHSPENSSARAPQRDALAEDNPA
jgi:hypothetical protein